MQQATTFDVEIASQGSTVDLSSVDAVTGGSRASVLIVEDQRLFADAMAAALEADGFDVVGTASNAGDALALARASQPDVVVTDIELPDRGGVAIGNEILREMPRTRVIALSALSDPRSIDRVLGLGFRAYVTKDTSVARFVGAVREAVEGRDVVATVSRRGGLHGRPGFVVPRLTPRELEVLRMLAEGSSGNTMALRLEISSNTVRRHVQSILTKFQVHSRLEAATFAVRHGMVDVGSDRDAARFEQAS